MPRVEKRTPNLIWHASTVTPEARADALRQLGTVVWFTGLSGSGKSTLSTALEARLVGEGRPACVLDGDNVRHGLCADLGFSDVDRRENVRRVAHVAALFAQAGVVVATAFISPFREERELARRLLAPGAFVEVHVATPLEECERRDPKGLYAKARAGQIPHFTGIDSPYEPPVAPELTLDTSGQSLDALVDRVHAHLVHTGRLLSRK
jgi:adenylylsulfate kinase